MPLQISSLAAAKTRRHELHYAAVDTEWELSKVHHPIGNLSRACRRATSQSVLITL
jgi:hypothetical protein